MLYPAHYESFLIQFSTNNVLTNQLKDSYTIQKKKAEENIHKITNAKYNLIRLPFLLPKTIFDNNSLPKQLKLLLSFIDLPYISFVPPSRNIYRPVNVQKIVDLTISKITHNNTNKKNETININGPKEMNLLEISKLILSEKKNKKKNIFFVIPFPWKILDFFLSKFPYLLNLFERSTILQQFLPIKR